MAPKGKQKKIIDISPDELKPPNVVPWCICGDGFMQCLACGHKIRVGGFMPPKKEGDKPRKRAWAPWNWWNKHSKCGG